jgi:hypothetical protein
MMQHVVTPLNEHLEQIVQALLAKLEHARAAGGPLEDVLNIVCGDRTRTDKVRPPSLWVFPGIDNITPCGGQTNEHRIEYIVVGIVMSKDPVAGRAAANDLAGRAYGVLMADKTLGGTVHALRPTGFQQSYGEWSAEVFAAAAVFEAVVRRRE